MQSKEHYFVLPNQSIDDIPNDIQHLYLYGFKDYENNDLICLNSFCQLKSLTICDFGFEKDRRFVLDGLESLESVMIGEYCFEIGEKERGDGLCRITNCPNLRQLEIGNWSFEDFKSFELSNLNSLQSIKFGYRCFGNSDCSFKSHFHLSFFSLTF